VCVVGCYQIQVQNLFGLCGRVRGIELRSSGEGELRLIRADDSTSWATEASALDAITTMLGLAQSGDRLIYFNVDHVGQGYALIRADHSRNVDRYIVTWPAPIP
jgi:hypothetical protein